MMNGHIEVESEKGVGTTFTVTVTLEESDRKKGDGLQTASSPKAENTQAVTAAAEKAGEDKADLKGRRILLAEDIMINAEIMKQIILMREAEIDHAENGRIALQMFENAEVGHYDAILMDVRMPEMDGLETTAAIRALDRPDAKAIPIIALTANAFDEDVQRSLQVGMNAHLSKPVEPERLYETLEELIWEAEDGKAKRRSGDAV